MAGRASLIYAMMTDATIIDATGQPTGKTLFSHFRARNGVLRNLSGTAIPAVRWLYQAVTGTGLPFPQGIPMHDAGWVCWRMPLEPWS